MVELMLNELDFLPDLVPTKERCILLQGIGVSQPIERENLVEYCDRKPTLLKRTDDDFISAVLDDLSQVGVTALISSIVSQKDASTVLELFQPVHRTFYLVLLEVACDPFGEPTLQSRLDPQQIASMGIVMRRLVLNAQGQIEQREGWLRSGKTIQGWLPFNSRYWENVDPDPAYRPVPVTAAEPISDRHLLPTPFASSENISPLFVAPPEVCQAAGRTILYGLVPVTSSERSQVPAAPIEVAKEDQPQLDRAIRKYMLPPYLWSRCLFPLPKANTALTYANADDEELQKFIGTLKQLKSQLNLFDPAAGEQMLALKNTLNQVSVTLEDGSKIQFGVFLEKATQVFVERQENLEIVLPKLLPILEPRVATVIKEQARSIVMNRLADLTAGEGRFEQIDRQYQLRAFIRVKCPNHCPPKLIWSAYSNRFTIAPWYANSDQPPVKVALPDVLNAKALANLKPSVAFSVPPKLANFLQGPNNSLKQILDNQKGDKGDEGGWAWVCSFNIPIITLCAYIVLNLFLQLFDLIFHWLLLIKICIPIPKKILPK